MTYSTALFKAIEKRIEDEKSIKEIGKELFPDVKNPSGKVIRLIRIYKSKDAQKFLETNEFLGYKKAHNSTRKNLEVEPNGSEV